MKKINNPHDAVFKSSMMNKKVAKEFFSEYLPEAIKESIDYSTLRLCSESYLDEELQKTASDVLYSVNFSGKEGYIYCLVEHQSTPDKWLPLRIIKYTCSIMERHRHEYPTDDLPLVIPIVLYHGKVVYPYSTDLNDLIHAPRELIENFLFKPFTLVDTHKIPDENLREKYWSGLMLYIFKHIFAREIMPYIESSIKLWQLIGHEGGKDYIINLVNYISTVAETADGQSAITYIANNIDKEIGDEVMTIAEQLIQKGKYEGISQGIAQGELNMLICMLEAKFHVIPEEYLNLINNADADTLLLWGRKAVFAKTMKDIFK
ncbi:MAG: Recombination-promoting nuclease RpnA [Legionellaceae bacterium]